MAIQLTTPGVYITEQEAFPSSVVAVPTAIPAFIGYTEKALRQGSDLRHIPTRIASLGDYLAYFGGGPKPVFSYRKPDRHTPFQLAEPKGRYLLYDCLKWFFANGGSDCYIVSIGDYHTPVRKEDMDGEELDAGQKTIRKGIRALEHEPEPTLLLIPDAVLLPAADCAAIQKSMLEHCGKVMGNRFAILDVHDGFMPRDPDPQADVIARFRESIGNDHLGWGAAYYPWMHTSITEANALDFGWIDENARAGMVADMLAEAEQATVAGRLNQSGAEKVKAEINKIIAARADDIRAIHQNLLVLSPLYKAIMTALLEQVNLLPPAAGVAGVYAMVDNTSGVFHAPANVSLNAVLRPAVQLTSAEQEDLNAPINGKAVNAIRSFPGNGVLIWGARTLDGNSQDWRYINVRRTAIFIEQSLKSAIQLFVFQPNTVATWTNVKALVAGFLTQFWQQGALAGAVAADAFSVDVGLGDTMTQQDLLDGRMRITVKVAITHPAEFIVITFEQQIQPA